MKIALINQAGVIGGQIPQADQIMVYDMELNTLMEYRGLEPGIESRADWLLSQQCEAAICSVVTQDMLESLNEYGIHNSRRSDRCVHSKCIRSIRGPSRRLWLWW